MLVALLLRTVHLSTFPEGFHGDEATIGLEAQHILRDGWIGPYSPYAAGQPTGPIYLTAASVWIFGNTVFAVRIVPALLGTLTVLALYVVVRRNLGVRVALIGSTILATMSWHIHFARLGFPLEAWPLVAVLLVGALVEAMRRSDWRWWAATGGLTALGIYVYNAHPLLAAIVFLVIAVYFIVNRKVPLRRDIVGLAVFAAAMLIVLIPMARFATSDDGYYWVHFRHDRTTDTAEWHALDGPVDRARFLAGRYRDVWDAHCCEPELDLVDGTGLTIVTPPLMLWLAGVGMLIGLWRYRQPLVYLGVLIIVIMPLGPVFTLGGVVRRTIVSAPFIAMFCALAAVGIVDLFRRERRIVAYGAATLAAFLVSIVVYQNLHLYFREFAAPDIQRAILGVPVADASKYLDGLPDDTYVYFYSNTWSIDYATRQFLAPDIQGEDRSDRFGEFSFDIDPGKGRPIFVFLGDYLDEVDTVRNLFPGREITPASLGDDPTFRVYAPDLPQGRSPPKLR